MYIHQKPVFRYTNPFVFVLAGREWILCCRKMVLNVQYLRFLMYKISYYAKLIIHIGSKSGLSLLLPMFLLLFNLYDS